MTGTRFFRNVSQLNAAYIDCLSFLSHLYSRYGGAIGDAPK